MQVSAAATRAMEELLPSDDPLDAQDFDVVAYLNQCFPSEEHLVNLDSMMATTDARIATLQQTLKKSVRDAAEHTLYTSVDDSIAAIHSLRDKVTAIKTKAAESERMVQEICADVKQLDCAKRNLTATFTALKRLHMMQSAVDQLQTMARGKQYREAAFLLDAVTDLFVKFDEFKETKRIHALHIRAQEYRIRLQDSIMDDFKSVGAGSTGPSSTSADFEQTASSIEQGMLEQLRHACTVLDVLGTSMVDELLAWVSKKQLEAYVAIFEPIAEAATDASSAWSLDNTERRFSWLRRQLQRFLVNFGGVFPVQWNVPGRICLDFCSLTHQHLNVVLNKSKDVASLDVQVLVRVLQRTVGFEEELDRFYAQAARSPVRHESSDLLHANYEAPRYYFKGIVSKCFAPFMTQYVDLERDNIASLIDRIDREEDWSGAIKCRGSRLSKVDELFGYIKKSLQRCSRLDRGKVLLEIAHEYRRGIRLYANLLKSKLQDRATLSAALLEAQTQLVCQIVNTAEYCADTLPQLRDSIANTIEAMYADDIAMDEEADVFHDLISDAVDLGAQSIIVAAEQGLSSMLKLSWGAWQEVGDTSEYIREIKSVFQTQLPPIAVGIASSYHSNICFKIAASFIPKYLASIAKCKHINGLGAQQLLLDAHDLETELKKLPRIGAEKDKRIPSSFTKFVTKEIGKAVVLLKTVGSPPAQAGETFRSLIRDGNFADLARILDLMGVKKADQQPIIDEYNKNVPPSQQMAPFLQEEGAKNEFSLKVRGLPFFQ